MYTVLIDESGDVGLNNVQPDPSNGPTQYFCLCGTIIRDENLPKIEEKLSKLPFSKKATHADHLNHFEKAYLCREISSMNLGMIGVISNKLTLGNYLKQAQSSPTHFYNKVMQYLLERVGETFSQLRIPKEKIKIVLESREQRYSSLLSFVGKIQKTPHDDRSLALQNISQFSITNSKKKEMIALTIPDAGAHAMFSAVRRDMRSFGLSETRYLHELRKVFMADKEGRILPKGIKPIHSVADLDLPEDITEFLIGFKNPNLDYHRLK